MQAGELIGKTIIDILGTSETMDGMDYFDAYLVLENNICVTIPLDFEDEMEAEFPVKASSLMDEKATYHNVKVNQRNLFWTWVLGPKLILKDIPVENDLRKFKGRKIIDLIKFQHDTVFVELENGFVFSAQSMAPNGLGMAHLFWYENPQMMEQSKGKDYVRYSAKYSMQKK